MGIFITRCDYVYDGLGNLYKKKCGQAEEQYIIDPFGNPGADIIGKVRVPLQSVGKLSSQFKKKVLVLLKITADKSVRYKTLPSPPPFKFVRPSFKHGVALFDKRRRDGHII